MVYPKHLKMRENNTVGRIKFMALVQKEILEGFRMLEGIKLESRGRDARS
jgi:hypothetical protein